MPPPGTGMLSVAASSGGSLRSLYARYNEVALRDPRTYPVGYLAADGETGAMAPFLWFRDEAELLRFVGTTELGLLRLAPLAHVEVLDGVGALARRERSLDRLGLGLTTAFRGWTEFLWVGDFADLCSGAGEIPCELRAELRAIGSRGETHAALAPEEIAELVGFLGMLATGCAAPDGGGSTAAASRPRTTA